MIAVPGLFNQEPAEYIEGKVHFAVHTCRITPTGMHEVFLVGVATPIPPFLQISLYLC